MIGVCDLCSSEVGQESIHHEDCHEEYWRRVKRGVCVRCGMEEGERNLMCGRCHADAGAPYVGYGG